MSQYRIQERLGVFYSINSISQLLKNRGVSDQKARFVSDHLDPKALQDWMQQTCKHIVLAQDGARYHTSAAMKAYFARHQDRLTVFKLPCYSLLYNPIEKLWKSRSK
jgi:hypothetical protein